MSGQTPTSPTPTSPTPTSPTAAMPPEPKKTLWERIPRRLFGGKVRTTTAVLVVLFLGGLLLYGQRSDHYATIDEQNRQAKVTQVQQPRTTEPEPEYTEPVPEYSQEPTTTEEPSTTDPTGSVDETAPTEQRETAPESPSESTSEAPPGGGLLPRWELPTISIAP